MKGIPLKKLSNYGGKVYTTVLDEVLIVSSAQDEAKLLNLDGEELASFKEEHYIKKVKISFDGLRFIIGTEKRISIYDKVGTLLSTFNYAGDIKKYACQKGKDIFPLLHLNLFMFGQNALQMQLLICTLRGFPLQIKRTKLFLEPKFKVKTKLKIKRTHNRAGVFAG
jgi:hypothetical protein